MNSQPQPEWLEAVEHLSTSDSKLAALIAQVGPCTIEIPHHFSIFYSLARSIIYQQLAGAAAAAIMGRVEALFPKGRMTPRNLLEMEDASLRGAGLSQNKLAALRDLAAKCLDGTVPTKRALAGMSDEAIIERISQVRGIGRWTVEMMLLFRLGRPNVLRWMITGCARACSVSTNCANCPTRKPCAAAPASGSRGVPLPAGICGAAPSFPLPSLAAKPKPPPQERKPHGRMLAKEKGRSKKAAVETSSSLPAATSTHVKRCAAMHVRHEFH